MIKFNYWMARMLSILVLSVSAFVTTAQTVDVSGTKQKWHDVTVTLTLPNSLDESAGTFRNNRMDVVFTSPTGNKLRVPGYFAGDGNAANSNVKAGNKYKAHLRPDEIGTWSYQVLFYNGTDVALQSVGQLPSPVHNLSGSVGAIATSNKSLPDLRAKGRLKYKTTGTNNERRYLQWSETGEYFLKFGPDSPENLLNYDDIDHDVNKNTCNLCTEHFYNPHVSDWNTGDPTWDGGKGKGLIGAINYVKNQQMNSMSMSLFGGDDKNVFPWTTPTNQFVFDISKLEQWQIVFQHAQNQGLVLHFKLAEAENWNALDYDKIRIYYREMVARFSHHLGIEWNISEEYGGSNAKDPASAIPRIDWLAEIDPYQNHRVIHTYPDNHEVYYNYFINNNAKLTGASVQSSTRDGYDDAYDGKSGIKTWVDKSRNNGKPWVVASDEQNPGSTGIFTSDAINNSSVIPQARKKILWKSLMAGGAGVMWYGGSKGDFQTENFNRFNTLFQWSRIALLDLFQANGIEYWKMANNDALASGNLNRCLAQPGKAYIVYLENGGTTSIDLNGQVGSYNVRWLNPRDGGNMQTGSVTSVSGGGSRGIGNPPSDTTNDWVALVTLVGSEVRVTGIDVSPATGTVEAGKTLALNATVSPANATDKSVSWGTNRPGVATVNGNGVVTGVSAGTVRITATTTDGGFTDFADITVTAAPEVDLGCAFEEQNGLLVIEAESAKNYAAAQFKLYTNTVGTTAPLGSGFLRYEGPNNMGSEVAANTISYKIKINTPGTYQFLWRNVRDPQASSADAANDSWLYIHGNGARFYGEKSGTQYTLSHATKVWVQKSDFVFECYGETHHNGTKINGMSLWATFASAGEYTIDFGGRSQGHSVDRLVLFQANQGAAARNIATPESSQGNCNTDPCTTPLVMSAADFPLTQVAGFVPAYYDAPRLACAINAAQHKGVFAAVKKNFAGADGTYDITITTLTELDGESSYRLRVGGVLVPGTYQNPETTTDYAPSTYTWADVSVKNGDAIQVEFDSHTNGKIPEGTTTAYSRGRWTQLAFCGGGTVPVVENVAFSNPLTQLSSDALTISVPFNYTAGQQRDINVELKDPNDAYVTNNKVIVGAGTGQATVNVALPSALAVAQGYKLILSIRPLGGDWTTNIDTETHLFDVVNQSCNDAIDINPPLSIQSADSYTVTMDYTACEARDVVLEFWNTNWIASGTATVQPGTGSVDVTVNLPTTATPGTGYIWKSSIRPVGTTWTSNIATDQVNGIVVTPATIEVDSVAISISSNSIDVGGTANVAATAFPANATNKTITFSSSNLSVATVDANGLVTGVASGTASIIATANNGVSASVAVNVTVPCQDDIDFNPPTSIVASSSISLDVAYAACAARDIVIEMWKGSTWIANGVETVQSGTGTASVVIALDPEPVAGNDYEFKLSIRPVGGNWTTSLDFMQVNGISITEPVLQSPFGGTPASVPAKVQAEDFDLGGEGIAYHDIDATNNGGLYRATEGVDIEASSDADASPNIGWMQAGEWLEYTVEFRVTQLYNLYTRVASANGGGQYRILIDGVDVSGTMDVSSTGSWQTYVTHVIKDIPVTAGVHLVRFEVITAGMNLNWWSAWKGTSQARLAGLEESGEAGVSIVAYPNPLSEGSLTVQVTGTSEASYVLRNSVGALVTSGQTTSGEVKIDAGLISASGVYFLQVEAAGQSFSETIIRR